MKISDYCASERPREKLLSRGPAALGNAELLAILLRVGKPGESVLDLIRNETVTCYDGIPGSGCGKCPACRLRNRGLRDYLKGRNA